MYEKACLYLAIALYGALVSESRVIVPLIKDESYGNEEIPFSMDPLQTETCAPNEVYTDCVNPCNDCQTRNIPCNFLICNKGCDCRPGYTRNDQRICIPENQCLLGLGKKIDPSAADDKYGDYNEGTPIIRRPFDNDYNEPDMDHNLPGTKTEKFPSDPERPQEDPEESDSNDDKDLGPSLDEDKPIHKDGDELEIEDAGPEEFEESKKDKEHKPEEEIPDEEKREEENEVKPDEEEKEVEDQEKSYEKKEEELDEEKPDEEEREEEEENEEKTDEEKKEEDMEKPDIKEDELDEEKPGEEKEEVEDEEKPEEEKEEVEDEEKPDEERKVEEEIEDEEKPDEGRDDDKKHITEEPIEEEEKIPKEVVEETDENDSKNKVGIPQEGASGIFKGGPIFDTPFFNLEKVKKYFSKLDRALGHVFQQTMDEALQLNSTYANTTEEEVDIDGKKYIITKSIIKGADNHSSMYIESLSAKPKMNVTEEIKDIETQNVTQT